ncbi:hypothetical protein B1J93_10435 [Leptospira kirschneri serovar Pomona]|uniref:Uncharacterized protein n=1 Tax=Leptospira kirschneri serovar Pomona TaxID=561005 RepID=A0A1T1DN60_9LEPT|nr:hypothetical protein B1J93_10435 [Leptospira kirschneri serovar Pomona]
MGTFINLNFVLRFYFEFGKLLWPKLRPRIGNLLELLQYNLTGKIVHKTVLLNLFQQERFGTAKIEA